MKKTVLLIGTLDSKGDEYGYVRDLIALKGYEVVLIDGGVVGEPTVTPTFSAEEVAELGGSRLTTLRDQHDRGQAMKVMSEGIAKLVDRLCKESDVLGVMGMGGSGGTALVTHTMRNLPIGLPKLVVSTVASGDVHPYIGTKDITMMYSVVDIAGLNKISRRILGNAAGALIGMIEQDIPMFEDKPIIAASMFGVTTTCVENLREHIEEKGYELLIFHATGSGGQAMESLISDGFIKGVADVTTTELCDELVGGVLSAGPHRLEAAAREGIPQVVSCGALDMVNFGAMNTVPSKFSERTLYEHNANVTLMRTTPEECAELGKLLSEKLNESTGSTTLFLPLKGVSAIDGEGQLFESPEATDALFTSIRKHLNTNVVELIELDQHINDTEFAAAMAKHLLKKMN
ncbi:UPF0261 family protein [Sporosarcina sp. BI001-red]|uniref:Tm-1-like ATP-binding domain-containing protein n=1 Tax=Sporosarcina sp. BI001-red TaxID=2282866 RepID=UPI000E23EFB4|nr:Tm-1-like ATP-binding domain-containing protein [Sporosarcina sp. BI001-red]REB05213.1 UPF0261 family protein [Sporosarcina sp. BI001-red]